MVSTVACTGFHATCIVCRWLKKHKHMRYMWIPHTDSVVVVACNDTRQKQPKGPGLFSKTFSSEQRRQPFLDLLHEAQPDEAAQAKHADSTPFELRSTLLDLDPLDAQWVKKVNEAEAEFWRRSQGQRVGWSDEILGFDCGGQQHVLEVAFPQGGTAEAPGKHVRLAQHVSGFALLQPSCSVPVGICGCCASEPITIASTAGCAHTVL